MKIIVTVKQVPDQDIPQKSFRVDDAGKAIVEPAGFARVLNGYDANALEEAVRLKEKHGGTVTAVTLGREPARDVLRYALAAGADAAVHLCDPAWDGADSSIVARLLAAAIGKIGGYDLVLCGRQASDTDGGQTHLRLAELLGLPAASPVRQIESIEGGVVLVQRGTDDGHQRLRVRLPALLGISSEINEPRTPPVARLLAARRATISLWTAADLAVGDRGPRVELRRLYLETSESKLELIDAGSPEASGVALAELLHGARLLS